MTDVPAFDGPHSSVDLWSDEVLADPFAAYAELRDLGPAVWLDRHDMVAVTRFAEVREALANWQAFSSASGVGVDPETNKALANSGTLGTDPPAHSELRREIAPELSAKRVDNEKARLRRVAEKTIEPLLARERFDVVSELAQPYVANVIGELLELPDQAIADLPLIAAQAFDLFGPTHERQQAGVQAFQQIVSRAVELAARVPGATSSSGPESEIGRLATYMFPGVDTTVQAVSAILYRFARHPGQWESLRQDPTLAHAAIAEVLRLHSPVRSFTRLTTMEVKVGPTTIAPGTRALIMYGCANRDERRFPDPEKFDITRPAHQHLAFGHGVHHCVGANLARVELVSLLEALLPRVKRVEVREAPSWGTGFAIHGLERFQVSFEL